MNTSRSSGHSPIRVLLALCLLMPGAASSTALYDIAGSFIDTDFGNSITATGQIHFVGDLSTDGTFPLSSTDIADFSLTVTCADIAPPDQCFSPQTLGLGDLLFSSTFTYDYTVALGRLIEIDLTGIDSFAGFILGEGALLNSATSLAAGFTQNDSTLSCSLHTCHGSYTLTPTAVPEPGTLALLALGLFGLAYRRLKS